MKIDLLTLDLFDTLVTRRVLFPSDVFLYQSEMLREVSLIDTGFLKNWQKKRIYAEKKARERAGRKEITIDDIYAIIKELSGMEDGLINLLKKMEFDAELKLVCKSRAGCFCAAKFIGKANRSVILSDMYLPHSVLEQIRQKTRIPTLDIIVSSETKKTKSTGEAYQMLKKNINKRIPSLVHIGDNWKSDIINAKKTGFSPHHFVENMPSDIEKSLYCCAKDKNRLQASLFAGAMRAARLQYVARKDKTEEKIWQLGANVTGPLVFLFVDWIIANCIKKGINTICFVARDGQLPFRLARYIKRKNDFHFQLKYIYGSRQSWHLPSLTEVNDEAMEWILAQTPGLSIINILGRVNLNADLFFKLCNNPFGIIPDKALTKKQISWVSLQLKTTCRQPILDQAEKHRVYFYNYLKQEGLLSIDRFALVDIGWHGRLQASLSRVLMLFESVPAYGLDGFYLGLNRRPELPEWSRTESFLFQEGNDPLDRNYEVFELLFSADHESTKSFFTDDHGKTFPVFSSSAPLKKKNKVRILHAGALSFYKEFKKVGNLASVCPSEKKAWAQCIGQRFLSYPPNHLVKALYSFSFSSNQEGKEVESIDNSVKKKDLFIGLVYLVPNRFVLWREGCIVFFFDGNILKNILLTVVKIRRVFYGRLKNFLNRKSKK